MSKSVLFVEITLFVIIQCIYYAAGGETSSAICVWLAYMLGKFGVDLAKYLFTDKKSKQQ